jgi:hypothetical protein
MPDPDDTEEPEHPYDRATAAMADLAERAVEYADIWRSAIERNADGEYDPGDLLVDLQQLWGLGVRDLARASSAFLEVVAPMIPKDVFGPGTSDEAPVSD